MAEKYTLNPDEFDAVVDEYVNTLENYTSKREEKKDQIIYRLTKDGEKKPSILTCYINNKGTSFSVAGQNQNIAKQLKEEIIASTKIEISESSCFTVKEVSEEQYSVICDFLKECDCTITREDSPKDQNVNKEAVAKGKYNDTIYIKLYHTGTLMVQGRPLLAFYSFIEIASELFTPSEVKKEHLKMFDLSRESNFLDKNLSTHLPNAYSQIGEKLDAIMAPSLILLNSGQKLDDYSAFSFPVLRGIEGILKGVFNDNEIEIDKTFKEYFTFKRASGKCEWAKETRLFEDKLKRKVLNLYNHYYKYRHATFHIDATITSSKTLTYSEAYEITIEGLALIDKIYAQ